MDRRTTDKGQRTTDNRQPTTILQMRKLLLLAIILLIALAAYLFIPPLRDPQPGSLTQTQRALLERVPADADVVAIVPSVAATYYKARTHKLTRSAMHDLREKNDPGLLPFILGNCDLVIWRKESETSYIANPDWLRRLLIRAIDRRVVDDDGILLLGRSDTPSASVSAAFAQLHRGAAGHVFVWQREGGRSFPPIGRPAVSTMRLEENALRVESLAPENRPLRSVSSMPLPKNAMLAAVVSEPPEWIDDLERALPIHISPLLDRGALFALYRIEDRPLFPRPFGVLALPAGAARAAELERQLDSLIPLGGLAEVTTRTVNGMTVRKRSGLGFVIESAQVHDRFVISFDKTSVEQFIHGEFQNSAGTAFLWSIRLVPRDVVPALNDVRENRGLRLVARDLSRGADRIYRSARWFESADEITSTARAEMGQIRLETVVLASK